jgi:glutamyl-tRNA(Gln) amidotransferase subunit E
MNYKDIDLKVGIEIHQELATKHKLFCACPPILSKEKPDFTFMRKLRPSQSELGEMDPSALFEFMKGKNIIYEADHETSCLVEMDEEPPGPLNSESLDICLIFSLLVNAKPVDEVHVMRKTVVDGSNTGGFQRTSVISLGGSIFIDGQDYGLEQICIEEDAARKIREENNTIIYRLDRLGIPLIEITTAPEMHSPNEVKTVATRIGSILRATGMVRRGLGTIRQDINVSIKGGPIIEIKGVQDLGLLETVVEYEAKRQLILLEIAEELTLRGIKDQDLLNDYVDVSEVFKGSNSRVLLNALDKNGIILAVKLPGFKGIIGKELCPNRRLGTEMSDHAKFKGNVRGIIHTDELPRYDITIDEINILNQKVGAGPLDAVVFVADKKDNCIKALDAVIDRAKQALEGIPEETRSANPDGTTRYTRPRPGAARMYPETDVKLIKITSKRLDKLRNNLPEMPEEKLNRLMKDYGLNEKLATQIVDSNYLNLFEDLSSIGVSTTLIAVTLTEDLTKLKRDGVPVDAITNQAIKETFEQIKEHKTAKESIPELLTYLSHNPQVSAKEAVKVLNLDLISDERLEMIIATMIDDNSDLIEKRGIGSIGPLMGILMAKVRGKVDAEHARKLLQKKLMKKLD